MELVKDMTEPAQKPVLLQVQPPKRDRQAILSARRIPAAEVDTETRRSPSPGGMYSVVILAALLLALLFLAFAMSGAPVPETPAAPPVPEASATPPVVVPPPQSEAARPVAVEREKGSKKELAAHLAAVEEAQRVSEGNARAARQERPQEQAAVQEARQPERAERREETRGARERGGEAEKPRLRSPLQRTPHSLHDQLVPVLQSLARVPRNAQNQLYGS